MLVDFTFRPAPPGQAPAAALRARELGFDGFFTAETSHDPFLPLALAAVACPGMTLGTAIAVAFPRSPMVVAQTAWDLQDLTGGRFILGLGTQVKPHIVRRFATPWAPPVPRMREYVEALRTIWRAFETGEALKFAGDHYQFSLLTPFFSPVPGGLPHPKIAIAGVGPALSRLAGEVCDGFHVHPFHTVKYLDEVVLASMVRGAAAAGRSVDDVARIVSVFVVTGRDAEEISAMREAVKAQIAFYASTPTYRVVLDTHGWDFGDRLNQMSRRGQWDEMGSVIPDEVVDEVAIVAPPHAIGSAIKARYGDRIQRVGMYNVSSGTDLSDSDLAAAVADLKRP